MPLFGLIGYPLTHSFSKKYFTEKFEKLGLSDHHYENFAIPHINDLREILLSNPALQGFNVTIPYKQAVLPFLDEKSETVRKIDACNCIRIVDGRLIGHNTDTIGFEKTLLHQLQPRHKHALILGTGGAAKAVEFVLAKLGIKYKIVSRQPAPGQISYDSLNETSMVNNTLIVNTTPLGMHPKIDEAPPIPYAALNETYLLYDLIYNPAKTLFLKNGQQMGATIMNGSEMLEIQAEESWNIWQG